MKKFSGTFPIYKSKAAAQFSLIPLRRDEKGRVAKDGAILLEVAPAVGEQKYEWKDKISFAMGLADVCRWMENTQKPPRLVHETPNSTLTKSLEFQPGEGNFAGTYMMKLGQKDSETKESKMYAVPLSAGEYQVLMRLALGSLEKMIGWNIEEAE